MTAAKKLFAGLLAAVALAPGLALAEYTAVAGGSGMSYSAYARTQAEANQAALNRCNGETPQKDCSLAAVKAVVRVANPKEHIVGYVSSEVSVQEAKDRALKKCGSPNCKIEGVFTQPGIYTIARSKNKTGPQQFSLSYGNLDGARSDAQAIDICEKATDFQCEIVWTGAVPGEVKP